jgi:hypothetical protein
VDIVATRFKVQFLFSDMQLTPSPSIPIHSEVRPRAKPFSSPLNPIRAHRGTVGPSQPFSNGQTSQKNGLYHHFEKGGILSHIIPLFGWYLDGLGVLCKCPSYTSWSSCKLPCVTDAMALGSWGSVGSIQQVPVSDEGTCWKKHVCIHVYIYIYMIIIYIYIYLFILKNAYIKPH